MLLVKVHSPNIFIQYACQLRGRKYCTYIPITYDQYRRSNETLTFLISQAILKILNETRKLGNSTHLHNEPRELGNLTHLYMLQLQIHWN